MPQTFNLSIPLSLWFCNGTLLQRRKEGENENDIPNVSRRWTRSISFLWFALHSMLQFYFDFLIFWFTLEENASPVFPSVFRQGLWQTLFTSWIDLSWNQDVHFTRDAPLYHRSVLVCQLSTRKELLKESTTFCYYQLQIEIRFLTCTKKNWVWQAKSQNFYFKRTLLFSLLCSYNSPLIQCYTHIISQKTSCFKCKLMLTQVFSD